VDVYERRAYEEQVELLRRMINRTPRWHVAEHDGHPVVVDDQDAVAFRIEGQWAPYLVDFFTSVRVDSLLKMLTVLEAATGTKAEKAAVACLRALRLDSHDQHRAI
jgi:hypothetical protein